MPAEQSSRIGDGSAFAKASAGRVFRCVVRTPEFGDGADLHPFDAETGDGSPEPAGWVKAEFNPTGGPAGCEPHSRHTLRTGIHTQSYPCAQLRTYFRTATRPVLKCRILIVFR